MEIKDMTSNAFWKGETGVKGLIEDQGNRYQVSLYLKGSQVYDYSCSCKEGNSYKGMCPHCRRLLEEWQKRKEEDPGRPVTTSQEVRTMIREYTNREVNRIRIEGEEDQVELRPRLLFHGDSPELELSLGRKRQYLLKDLTAFAEAMEQGAWVEYGKQLAFHHSPAVFTEDSRELLLFVLKLVNGCREHYRLFQKSAFATVPSLRRLPLGRGDLDQFLALSGGRMLEIEDGCGEPRQVQVRGANPSLTIRARRLGRDGVEISLEQEQVSCLRGETGLYVLTEDTLYLCDQEYNRAAGVFLEQLAGNPAKKGKPGSGGRKNGRLEIQGRDMPLFYERVIQRIAAVIEIREQDISLESYKPEELKASFRFDSPEAGTVVMEPTLSYGSVSFHPVEDEGLPRTVCRDVPGEFRISQVITRYFSHKEAGTQNPVIRDDEDALYRLISQGMEEFMALGQVFVSDSVKKMRLLPPPRLSVGVQAQEGWLELTIDAEVLKGQELSRILGEYREKRPYYRLKSGEFLRLDDNGLMTVARLAEELGLSDAQLRSGVIRLPGYRALYLDHVLKEDRGISLYRDPAFKSIIRGMKSVEDSDYQVPESLREVLRGYQKTGFRWLKTLDQYGFGGILADDMGLGKTIQVLALLLDEAGRCPDSVSLIVCPASLIYNWENECSRFAPSLRVAAVAGTAAQRVERLADLGDLDVVITSYDLLKRDWSLYQKTEFRYQVIDEAQNIKNASTQSARAVKSVRARTRFALTGTPVENRLSELWSIFDYLMPGFLFSYQRFRREYELPVVRDADEEALIRLHGLTGPFVLRRLKQDVLKELPEKLELPVYSRFEPEQNRLYQANAQLLKQQLEELRAGGEQNRMQVLAQMTRLRQICCDPSLCYDHYHGGSAKLETCLDLIRDSVNGGHRLLLFSQFASMLERIGTRLSQEGISWYLLTGATPREERMKLVNGFQKGQVPVFLISLKAGGTGLNLTAADQVIHYEPWWNLAAQNQATDRAYRIGQEKQVTVYQLIVRHTIEENIRKLQESKQTLSEQVIGARDGTGDVWGMFAAILEETSQEEQEGDML